MDNIHIFYHIFFENNWLEIVSEQLNRLHNSGLLSKSKLKIGVVFGHNVDSENNLKQLEVLLNQYYNYEIMFVEPTGCCGESRTIKEMSDFSQTLDETSYILYFHTKGITQYNSIREKPVTEWRRMMEYFLIDKWGDCISKLNDGYDCCGINYQNHSANINNEIKIIKIFNGNFFWVKSDYVKNLDNSILFEHRYSPENWILSSEHRAFSFLDVPPIFDLYYNIYDYYGK